MYCLPNLTKRLRANGGSKDIRFNFSSSTSIPQCCYAGGGGGDGSGTGVQKGRFFRIG